MTGGLLCFVTDRRRLTMAPQDATDEAALLDRVADAARAGVDLIQIREPDLEARDLARLVERAVDAVRGTRARVLVNERLDVALAAGAHGVHLPAASVDARRVRKIAPDGFMVGRSVHGVAEAVATASAGGLDYLLLGTVFPSRSKPEGHPVIGTSAVSDAARAVQLPILAIGGVTLANAAAVARAGAAGVAAIGLFEEVDGTGEDRANRLAKIVQCLRRLFDTSHSSSLR